MTFQKENYIFDEEHGPLHYHPYAGGTLFPEIETLTDKPGFKIWVDGGVLDYEDSLCIEKKLDCSATCCMQSYCAPHNGLCLNYKRRPYFEVYIGIMVVLMIVLGIPTCILTVEFVLNFKFCQKYNEEVDAMMGGMTICEAITYVVTCGKSQESPDQIQDDYVYRDIVPDEEEPNLADGTAPKQAVAAKPAAAHHHHHEDPKPGDALPTNFEDPGLEGDADNVYLLNENLPPPTGRLGNKRNCCMRLICLVCCCDTFDLGSQSHLN